MTGEVDMPWTENKTNQTKPPRLVAFQTGFLNPVCLSMLPIVGVGGEAEIYTFPKGINA